MVMRFIYEYDKHNIPIPHGKYTSFAILRTNIIQGLGQICFGQTSLKYERYFELQLFINGSDKVDCWRKQKQIISMLDGHGFVLKDVAIIRQKKEEK